MAHEDGENGYDGGECMNKWRLLDSMPDRINYEEFQRRAAMEAIAVLSKEEILAYKPDRFADANFELYNDEIRAQVDDFDEAGAIFHKAWAEEMSRAIEHNWQPEED